MKLSNPALLRKLAFINGEWVAASSGKTFAVVNPFNQEVIAEVADLGEAEAEQSILAAHAALSHWRETTAQERADLLRRWFNLLMEHQEDLALLMTWEQGKPLAESRGEIAYGGGYIEWFAEEAKRAYGQIIPTYQSDRRLLVTKEPVGVCALITPWNFPNAMIARKVAPALAAGCTVVIKPAQLTPLSALAMTGLAEKAGIPAGVINVVTSSDAKPIGKVFATHPLVKKISFTGSTAVGKKLMAQAAETVKKVSLELGGNAPFIVFDDADIDAAVDGLMAAKFRNTGQTCICVNRVLVQDSIHATFVKKLSHAIKKLQVGNGTDQGVDVGPLINSEALNAIEELLVDAKAQGANIILGGKRHELGNTFFEPTLVDKVNANMKIATTEIFGPVATIFTFETEDKAIAMANDTQYGLASYFYSSSSSRVWRVMEQLAYGMVGINTGLISTPVAPFGGVKESGIGREGGSAGIDEYLETKYACIGMVEQQPNGQQPK